MTTITVDQTYTAADPCGFQTGLVACDGTPLLEAAGGDTRLYNGVISYEYNEVLTPERRDVAPTGNGANAASRTIDPTVDGYTMVLNNCAKMHPAFLVQAGVADPVYSDGGAIIGTEGFNTAEGCRCGSSTCVNGGIYMIIWARAFGCEDNEELVDENGDTLSEVTIFPWIKRLTPTAPSRRTQNLNDGTRSLRASLKSNPNFLYGPGMADPEAVGNLYPTQPDDTVVLEPVGLIKPYAQYLTTIPFPGACACVDHGAAWDPLGADPIPVGEVGWVTTPAP